MLISEIISRSPQEISVVYAEKERVRPGRTCGPVIRSVYIIECCTGGGGSVVINGKEFPLSAGAAYVLLPGDAVKHTASNDTYREGLWCALDGISIEAYLKEAGISSDSPFISPALFDDVRHWLSMLVQCWTDVDSGAQLRQTACAYGLLGAILQNKPAAEKDTSVTKAIGFMQINYSDSLSVDDIAQQIGLERTYFSYLFKRETGISPHQYLTRLRIRKACQLLDTERYSISEVSYLVGLDPHNFSRLFKKEMEISPLEYHRKAKHSASLLHAMTVPSE